MNQKKVLGPDELEAWCVALAAFCVNFVMAGLGRMSGILYVGFIEIFQVDRRQASLPFSVRASMRNFMGPVVGIFGQKYGARPVIFAGGVIGTLSAAACFNVDDILWITILWGGFSGIGAAMTTTLNQAVISQHFKKHRATAAGIAISGGCIGSFIFPVLMEYLLNTFGLGGTFLIIAGILMHVIPAGLILKKPSWLKEKNKEIKISTVSGKIERHSKKGTQVQGTEKKSYRNYGYENDILAESSEINSHSINDQKKEKTSQENFSGRSFNQRKINTNILWANRKLVMRLLTNDFTLQVPLSEINQYKSFCNDTLLKEIEDLFYKIGTDVHNDVAISAKDFSPNTTLKADDDVRFKNKFVRLKDTGDLYQSTTSQTIELTSEVNLNAINGLLFYLKNLFQKVRKDIFQPFSAGELKNISVILEELWNLYVVIDYKMKEYQPAEISKNSFLNNNGKIVEKQNSNTFWSHIKTACHLYTKPLFLLICLCRSVHQLTFTPVVTTIVDFSMDKGLPEGDGKYVIAALSLGDLMGRLCFGWITDKGFISVPRYMLLAMVIQGASTASMPYWNSRATLMPAIAVFGLIQGSIFVRHPVLVSRYLKSHEISIAMGCLNFFSGFLGFVLPIYIGYFRDTIGSYDGIFYINAAIGTFIGLLWIFEPYLNRKAAPKS